MKKYIKMLKVMENIEIQIIVNDNTVSVIDKDYKRLFFKIVPLNEDVNEQVVTMINNHCEKGFVITAMNLFSL